MSNLLTLQYWFKLQPEPLISLAWNILIGLVVLYVASSIIFAILKIRSSVWRGIYKRLYAFSLTMVLIGLFVIFSNYEQVPFFMARFWIGLWGIIMVSWLFFILRSLRIIPQKKKELADQKEREKYLP